MKYKLLHHSCYISTQTSIHFLARLIVAINNILSKWSTSYDTMLHHVISFPEPVLSCIMLALPLNSILVCIPPFSTAVDYYYYRIGDLINLPFASPVFHATSPSRFEDFFWIIKVNSSAYSWWAAVPGNPDGGESTLQQRSPRLPRPAPPRHTSLNPATREHLVPSLGVPNSPLTPTRGGLTFTTTSHHGLSSEGSGV